MDSEGIGSFEEDQNHDTRIFLLALLLSSYFIFNSVGTIDEQALQNLYLIVNMAKSIQIKSGTANIGADAVDEDNIDSDELAKFFPTLMWVVRDFALRLLDNDGNKLT